MKTKGYGLSEKEDRKPKNKQKSFTKFLDSKSFHLIVLGQAW